MSSPLVETSTVAERLKITPRQVSRLVKANKLAFAQKAPGLRGAYLFEPEEVDRIVAERGQ